MANDNKRRLIQLVHIAKNDLALSDEHYRDQIELVTGSWSEDGDLVRSGKRSASKCTEKELEALLSHFKQKGFKVRRSKHKLHKPRVAASKRDQIDKIEALLTVLKKPWTYAESMAKRMFDKDRLTFCDKDELWRITAALEKQKKREVG